MQTTKMSLANIQGKLSRAEMKNIMAGSGTCALRQCNSDTDCCPDNPKCTRPGTTNYCTA